MLEFLTAPYPFRRNQRAELLFILGAGLFVAGFLIYFQPFGTHAFQSPHKNWFLAGYGLIVTLTLLVFRNLLPALAPAPFRDNRWTVGRHILWILLMFTAAITGCYGYWAWYFALPFDLSQFWGFFRLATSVAVFPISFFVLADYIFWLKHYQQGAVAANGGLAHRTKPTDDDPPLLLRGENAGEELSLCPAQVLFLQAADNYVEVVYLLESVVTRTLLRGTLTGMEAQLPTPPFLRCHRSYLVNLSRVEEVTGNAQGYQLHLQDVDEEVPVSRSRGKAVLRQLK